MTNQNYANPDPGLVRRLRELGTPEAEIPARAAAIMREVDAALRPLVACGACDHDRELHAFFPTGGPAPFCIGRTYRYGDTDTQCECEGFAPQEDSTHFCEYTADGGTQAPQCGKPATVINPHGASGSEPWFDYDEWFCDEHADPAWLAARP